MVYEKNFEFCACGKCVVSIILYPLPFFLGEIRFDKKARGRTSK
jgi:hypothetical protein